MWQLKTEMKLKKINEAQASAWGRPLEIDQHDIL